MIKYHKIHLKYSFGKIILSSILLFSQLNHLLNKTVSLFLNLLNKKLRALPCGSALVCLGADVQAAGSNAAGDAACRRLGAAAQGDIAG